MSDTGMKQAKPGERTGAAYERLNMFLKADVIEMKGMTLLHTDFLIRKKQRLSTNNKLS